VLTSNTGELDHWARRRFIDEATPDRRHVDFGREGVSAQYLAELQLAYAGRPDLYARYAEGRWMPVNLGAEVAVGYREDRHVLAEPVAPVRGPELWMGHDAGHMPSTVIAQRIQGRIVIYAGLVTMHAGFRQHCEQTLLPWLGMHAPWALGDRAHITHRYDPSMTTGDQGDVQSSALAHLRKLVPGAVQPGPVSWPGRWEPLGTALGLYREGEPVLAISPDADTRVLRRALAGAWYFPRRADGSIARELPKKPNPPYADVGDALTYLLAALQPVPPRPPTPPRPAVMEFDAYAYDRPVRTARQRTALLEWEP
jgi:hypothetical protein